MSLRSNKEIAAEIGCSVRTVLAYRKRGAPVENIDALKLWITAQRSGPIKDTAKDIHDAKLEKLLLECERLRLGNDETKSNVIPKTTAAANMGMMAAAMKARLHMLIGECPAWAGLRPHEIQARAKEWYRQTCEALHDKASACYGK